MKQNYMFECFCCYNELWCVTLGIIFQDGPFLIGKLIILISYRAVTQINDFWAAKNVFVFLLLLNRVRVGSQKFAKAITPISSCLLTIM